MKRTGISETDRARPIALLSGLVLIFALCLGGCGQRGPLYLPDGPDAAEETTEPAAAGDNENEDKEDDEATP